MPSPRPLKLLLYAAGISTFLFCALSPAYADEVTVDEIDIPEDWLGAAVSAKFGEEDAVRDYDGNIPTYTGETLYDDGGGNQTAGDGSLSANVLGSGNGTVRSKTGLYVHSPEGSNLGTGSQSLKPFVVNGSGTVNTTVQISFDGLLVTDEQSGDADDWSRARVEYLAEIQQVSSGQRQVVGSNTFEGMAYLQQAGGGAAAQSFVPETFTFDDFPDETIQNTWADNNNLSIRRVVNGAAGAGQISRDDLTGNTQTEADAHIAAGREVFYLLYEEDFNFNAAAGQTYYIYMDLATSTRASDTGGGFTDTYALSDFSNTVAFDLSGGDSITTNVLIAGSQGVSASNPFGGATTDVTLDDATLNFTANATLNEDVVLDAGSSNTLNTNANTDTIAGVISGSGGLTKTGAGTLIYSGANTYTGGTTISAGTLQTNAVNTLPSTGAVSVAGTLNLNNNNQMIGALNGAGTVTLGSATLTAGNGGGTGTFSGVVGGTGGLTKTGAGTLTLSGVNTTTGTLAANAGQTVVNGSWAGAASVGSGGILSGAGTLEDVTVSGTLKPGNSIGTLTVNGDYTQVSGSSLEVEFNNTGGAGNVDLVDITGAAVIQGGASLVPVATTNITRSLNYTFLSAAGGITGSFSSIVDNYALLDFSAAVNATNYQLTVSRVDVSEALSGADSSQSGLAASLDVLYDTNSSGRHDDINNLLNQLDTMPDSEALSEALEQLSPEMTGSTIEGSQGAMGQFMGSVGSRLGYARSGLTSGASGFSSGDFFHGTSFWVQGMGAHAEQGRRKGIDGYQANTFGTALGADRLYGQHLRAGVGTGYSYADVNSRSAGRAQTDISSYQATFYGSYDGRALNEDGSPEFTAENFYFLDTILGFAHNEYEGDREISVGTISRTARSDYSGQHYAAKIEGGYTYLCKKTGVEITPLASLEYSYLRTHRYSEKGAGGLGLRVEGEGYHTLEQGLGLKLGYPVRSQKAGLFVPSIKGMWLYDYIGDKPETTSSFTGGGPAFTTSGADPAQHAFVIGPEIIYVDKGNMTLTANYDWELRDEYSGHAYYLTARFDF